MGINAELLKILACPKCQAALTEENGTLLCGDSGCGLRFPIRDGIPVLLVEEAERPAKS